MSSQFHQQSHCDSDTVCEIPASRVTEEAIRPRKYAEVIGKSICPIVGAIEYPMSKCQYFLPHLSAHATL